MRQPPLADLLDWLADQRWFAARSGDADAGQPSIVPIVAAHIDDGLEIAWWLLRLPQRAGGEARLLLAMACCTPPSPVRHAVRAADLVWFDALAHPTTAGPALALLGRGEHPSVSAHWLDDPAPDLANLDTAPREQTNTSLFSGEHVFKVFRRPPQGRNPEVEVGQALRAAGSRQVAELAGWVSVTVQGASYDALTAHRRIDGTDGFALALADVARARAGLPNLHFPGAAYELGSCLGVVHSELAAALGEHVVAAYGAGLSRRLQARLNAIGDVAELAPYLPAAAAIFGSLARLESPVAVHRVHGDLHLGQTLLAADGWRLIDFEGEPRRGLAERRSGDTGLRDVAGLIRSFDYAARWDGDGAAATEWRTACVRMLLEGYRQQRPDAVQPELLDALLLDKALYEVGYEAAHRPERVRIPLAAVAALCGDIHRR